MDDDVRRPEYIAWCMNPVENITPEEEAWARKMLRALNDIPQPSPDPPEDNLAAFIQRFEEHIASIREALRHRARFLVRHMDKCLFEEGVENYRRNLSDEDDEDLYREFQYRILMHPDRRLPTDNLFICLATKAGHFLWAFEETWRMRMKQRERASTLSFYFKDPEVFSFDEIDEIFSLKLVEVASAEEPCPVCYTEFGSGTDSGAKPLKSACNHILCRKCYKTLLTNTEEGYICPMCRQCLLCDSRPCFAHVLNPEDFYNPFVTPLSLQGILYHELPKEDRALTAQEDLYFRMFREETRLSRVRLAIYEDWMYKDTIKGEDQEIHRKGYQQELDVVRNLMTKYQIREILASRPLEKKSFAALIADFGNHDRFGDRIFRR